MFRVRLVSSGLPGWNVRQWSNRANCRVRRLLGASVVCCVEVPDYVVGDGLFVQHVQHVCACVCACVHLANVCVFHGRLCADVQLVLVCAHCVRFVICVADAVWAVSFHLSRAIQCWWWRLRCCHVVCGCWCVLVGCMQFSVVRCIAIDAWFSCCIGYGWLSLSCL